MKILAIADVESKALWDYYDKERVKDIDVVVSCGDLDPEYLTFLATMTNLPVLYVHGNHDEKYLHHPPEGCINIDGRIETIGGVRFLGLGGSMQYKPGKFMYTESQMARRAMNVFPKIIYHRGFDVLVTHSPARGLGDEDELPHRGFPAFNRLIDTFKPKLFLHGHVHLNYGYDKSRYITYNDTEIINAYDHEIIEFDTE